MQLRSQCLASKYRLRPAPGQGCQNMMNSGSRKNHTSLQSAHETSCPPVTPGIPRREKGVRTPVLQCPHDGHCPLWLLAEEHSQEHDGQTASYFFDVHRCVSTGCLVSCLSSATLEKQCSLPSKICIRWPILIIQYLNFELTTMGAGLHPTPAAGELLPKC